MYAKLFASLYQGTLRGQADAILVFTNLLAHADSHGYVDKHFLAISQECGISEERVQEAIKFLESPDPKSRSIAEGGARLVRMDEHRDWGWVVVNYIKYRNLRREEDRREQNRLAQAKRRSSHVSNSQHASSYVSNSQHASAESAKAEAYVEAYAKAKAKEEEEEERQRGTPLSPQWILSDDDRSYAKQLGLNPDIVGTKFKDYYLSVSGEKAWKRDWVAAWRSWCNNERPEPSSSLKDRPWNG
jgi:hypothetical protein